MDLNTLFKPSSVALIGASEKNPWTGLVLRAMGKLAYQGSVQLVNRRGAMAFGREVRSSCVGLGSVDAAFIALPAGALLDGIEDMAAAGIRYGTVITSGLAEVGARGAAEQTRIFGRARDLGVTLLGPNSMGFINFADRICLGALPINTPVHDAPRVGVISQSGAMASIINAFAHQQGVGLSYSISTGNEAMVDLADLIEFLVADAATRAIAVFAEAIRNPTAFRRAAAMAGEARKPIVILKVGTGVLTASLAQAHTGAFVGDDHVFDAVCSEFNIVRVKSIEDLIVTSDLLAALGPVDAAKGFALVSISGGACEMVADRGAEAGIDFPAFAPATRGKLQSVLSEFGSMHNPLDITGAAVRNPEIYSGVIRAVGQDPNIGLIGVVAEIPFSEETASPVFRDSLREIASGISQTTVPSFLIQQSLKPVTHYGREVLAAHGAPVVSSGLDHGVRAVGHLYAWSRKAANPARRHECQDRPSHARPATERATMAFLASAGVPVIPQRVVNDRDSAIAVAREFAGAVALKILSPDIRHKTEVGGVMLAVQGDSAVGTAFDTILASVAAAKPEAALEGLLISPMRQGGVELLVGVARDPLWGLVLALSMGGVWVEVLDDSRLKILPISAADARIMIEGLKGVALLKGYRGSTPADLDRLSCVIADIGAAAIELGSDLETLEINPLRVDGAQIEALDALAIWRER